MKQYAKLATAGVALSIVGVLVGCGNANGTTGGIAPTNTANQVATNTATNTTNTTNTTTNPKPGTENNSTSKASSTTTNFQTVNLRSVYTVETNQTTYQIRPGQVNYNPASQMIHVITTNKGIVWNPIPKMKLAITNQTLLKNYPLQPFSICLNEANDSTLSTSDSTKLFSLPLQEKTSSGSTVYPFLTGMYGAGDFVVYSVDLRAVGAAQPTSSELYVLNLNNNSSGKVTSYRDVSGNQFSIAISGGNVYYKQMLVNGPESIHEYNLKTGASKQLTWAPSGLKWISL